MCRDSQAPWCVGWYQDQVTPTSSPITVMSSPSLQAGWKISTSNLGGGFLQWRASPLTSLSIPCADNIDPIQPNITSILQFTDNSGNPVPIVFPNPLPAGLRKTTYGDAVSVYDLTQNYVTVPSGVAQLNGGFTDDYFGDNFGQCTFVLTESPPSPCPDPQRSTTMHIIDDSGATYVGTWTVASGVAGAFGNSYHYIAASSGATATYTFTGLSPGNYQILATWSPPPPPVAVPTASDDVPYTVYDGTSTTPLGTFAVNQSIAPISYTGSNNFQVLGNVSTTTSKIVITISNQADAGSVIADAVALTFP